MGAANMMNPSILAGTTTRANASKEWMKAAGMVVGGATLLGPLGLSGGIAAMSAWLFKAFVSGKKKSNSKELEKDE